MTTPGRTLSSQEQRQAEWERVNLALTGAMVYMEAAHSGCFEDKIRPETVYLRDAPVGTQSGTYFKTARTRDGMTVWRWGGRDPVEIAPARLSS